MTWFLASLLLGTSLEPLRLLVVELAGPRVETFSLIPPGASPHTYDPKPRDFARLHQADAVILVGPPLDHWIRHPRRLVLKELLSIPDTANPHIWLSFRYVREIARILTDSLKQWDPDGAAAYGENLARFLARLDEVEAFAREIAPRIRPVVVYHPAWSVLFEEVGIPVVGMVERHHGGEPSPKALAHLIRIIRKERARLLILEPGASRRLVHTLLEETALDTVSLDPLGFLGHPETFTGFLRINLERLARAAEDHDTRH